MAQPVPVHWDDGSELTRSAWDLLEKQAPDLGLPDLRILPLADFLRDAEQHRTSTADRDTIVHQATLIFDHFYPHMPFKDGAVRVPHPSDYLRQEVQPNLESLTEIDFHARMTTAFSLGARRPYAVRIAVAVRARWPSCRSRWQAYLDQKSGDD